MTDTRTAYTVAQGELFNLAAYGHLQHWPTGYALRADEEAQRQHYCKLIAAAQAEFEAAILRKAADDYERAEAERHPGAIHGAIRRIRAYKVGSRLRRMADAAEGAGS